MKNKKGSFARYQFVLRFVFDIITTLIAWFASYFLRFYILPGATKDLFGLFSYLGVLAVGLTELFMFFNSMYDNNVTSSWRKEVGGLFLVVLDDFVAIVVLFYFLFPERISRIALVLYAGILFLLLLIDRRTANSIIEMKVISGRFKQRTLVVGYGKKLEHYYKSTVNSGDSDRIQIIGQYQGKKPIDNLPQISATSLAEAVKENDIEIVVIGFPIDDLSDTPRKIANEGVELLDAKVFYLTDIPHSYAGSVLRDFHNIPTTQLNSSELSLSKRFIKRATDLVLCIPAVILLSPLYLFLAFLVKATSKGPVFFKQRRVTRDGKVFNMLKFRSMRIDMPEQNGPHFTEENDPRITRLGKFMRRTSIDELPQFFNVIGGSMSLIGPRPERPELVEKFKKEIPGYDLRHIMKAGISGWAQVNGLRGNTSIEKRLDYDLYYVRNWSLYFDMKIVILTFFKGFINKNAY